MPEEKKTLDLKVVSPWGLAQVFMQQYGGFAFGLASVLLLDQIIWRPERERANERLQIVTEAIMELRDVTKDLEEATNHQGRTTQTLENVVERLERQTR